MKTKSVLFILLYALLLSACVGVTPYPTPPTIPSTSTISPTTTETTTPTPTNTPTLTPTRQWHGLTPETLYGYPTPEIMIIPTCGIDGCLLKLTPEPQRQELTFHELYVGKYVVRNWCVSDPKVIYSTPCAVTVSAKGMEQIEVWGYGRAWVGAETGADLTGNGVPEIVIVTTYGGASDSTGKIVYEAGDTLKKIMHAHGNGTFIDLNDDGAYEYIAQRRIWTSLPMGGNIWINVVYEYQKGQDYYMLATSNFTDKIEQGVEWNFDALAEFEQEHPDASLQFEVFDHDYGPAEISLYRIVAYYLLAGEEDAALEILNKYFSEEKASEYLLVIKSDMGYLVAP